MTDPVFETREALEAWVSRKQSMQMLAFVHCKDRRARSLGNRIRRVTAAHQHLKETPRHDP